jgi:hypothetical protein
MADIRVLLIFFIVSFNLKCEARRRAQRFNDAIFRSSMLHFHHIQFVPAFFVLFFLLASCSLADAISLNTTALLVVL